MQRTSAEPHTVTVRRSRGSRIVSLPARFCDALGIASGGLANITIREGEAALILSRSECREARRREVRKMIRQGGVNRGLDNEWDSSPARGEPL